MKELYKETDAHKRRELFDAYVKKTGETGRDGLRKVLFLDLNTISADKYDALGQEATRPLFNDNQHSRKAGAKLNAESVVAGNPDSPSLSMNSR